MKITRMRKRSSADFPAPSLEPRKSAGFGCGSVVSTRSLLSRWGTSGGILVKGDALFGLSAGHVLRAEAGAAVDRANGENKEEIGVIVEAIRPNESPKDSIINVKCGSVPIGL